MLFISLWKWAYTRFISDPQVVTDLNFEEVDEINKCAAMLRVLLHRSARVCNLS